MNIYLGLFYLMDSNIYRNTALNFVSKEYEHTFNDNKPFFNHELTNENGNSITNMDLVSSNKQNGNYHPLYTISSNGVYTEENFDEIESLRSEVKQLSDVVRDQSKQIALLQSSRNLTQTVNDDVMNLDFVTELCQQKISLSCLERENSSLEVSSNQLKRELVQLSASMNQQNEEMATLHSVVKELRNAFNDLTLTDQMRSPHMIAYSGVNGDRDSHRYENSSACTIQPPAGISYCSSRVFFPSVTELPPYADSQRSVSCNELRHYSTGQQNGVCWGSRYGYSGRPIRHSDTTTSARPPLHPPSLLAASTRTLTVRPARYNPACLHRSLRNGNRQKGAATPGNDGQAMGSQGKLSGLAFFLKSPKLALRRSSSRSGSNKLSINEEPLSEDEFQSVTDIPRPKSVGNYQSMHSLLLPTSTDFEEWQLCSVCKFLNQLGLGYCENAARSWVTSGSDLIASTSKKLEQDLGIVQPLHLKKLLIHISLRTTRQMTASRDTAYMPPINPSPDFSVSTWLEDLGLSMYREIFESELVDAYVLHELTLADLLSMNVTTELHMLSLRRGLQVLRQINFDLSLLCRRPILPCTNSRPNSSTIGRRNRLLSNPQQMSSPSPSKMEPETSENSEIRSGNEDAGREETEIAADLPSEMTESIISLKSTRSLPSQYNTSTSPNNLVRRKSTTPRNTVMNDKTSFDRSSDTIFLSEDKNKTTTEDLALWTFHRLEVWLRDIELPEYVSNLRGSGLHGSLFVFEDRFNADTLASVLDIAPNKTLLRRHLTEKFVELISDRIWSRKQRLAAKPGSHSLTVFGKFKISTRRTIFPSPKKRAIGYLESELVCPLEADFDFMESFVPD